MKIGWFGSFCWSLADCFVAEIYILLRHRVMSVSEEFVHEVKR